MAIGIITGGILGGAGYGIRQWWAGRAVPPVNNREVPYPEVNVPGYGKVPFPEGPYTPHNSATYGQLRKEFNNAVRPAFEQRWRDKGLSWPIDAQVHHIKPLSHGGTNEFTNLVPLRATPGENNIHNLFTQWWRHFHP
jgi:hypothetical protein